MRVLRKRSTWLLLIVVLLPILIFFIWYGRQVRQRWLDHALIEAIKKEDTKTAISLLDAGADANAVDKPDKPPTPTRLCVEFWNRLKGEAPPDNPTHYVPALLLPYWSGSWNVPIEAIPVRQIIRDSADNPLLVEALLAHGADSYAKDGAGLTVLHTAVRNHHLGTVRVLLTHHVNPNTRADITGATPLMGADYDCSCLLLTCGADVNATDEDGNTLLMEARDLKVVRLMLDHPAELDRENRWHRTALTYAIMGNQIPKARLLLQKGAKVSLRDIEGKTPLDYARERDNDSVRELIPLLEAALRKEQAQKGGQK